MDILESINRINEAYCVKRDIPVTRRYRDDELTEARKALDQAERDLNHTNEAPRHD